MSNDGVEIKPQGGQRSAKEEDRRHYEIKKAKSLRVGEESRQRIKE
jgi:hypothetical protein